ncbi:hypothetical protein SALBM135S_04126 [Streptomyces alboniger]
MTQSPATSLPSPKERRRLREAKSLSQGELAATLGVSREAVRSWESGRMDPEGPEGRAYAKLLTAPTGTGTPEPHPEPPRVRQAKQHPESHTHPPGPTDPRPAGPTDPVAAFDALCAWTAPALVRQAYLLTGRRSLAQESVERAFHRAWQRWPEVAVDRDPAGWVRAAVHDYAMSPWHRFRPGLRHPDALPADPTDRAFLRVLLSLPPAQRRTLLLYDGVGLDLPETAAETEASTPAAAYRLMHARETVADALPALAAPEEIHRRLGDLAATEKPRPPTPERLRRGGEHRARVWTRAAIAFTALIIGATALTLQTAPTRYEAPLSPGRPISNIPPRMGPAPLTAESRALRAYLDAQLSTGPGHLTPDLR